MGVKPRKYGILLAAIAASAGLLGGGIATAAVTGQERQPPPASDSEIANLGKTKEKIKAYYGDYEVDGEHYASRKSNYAQQVYGIQRDAKAYLSAAKPDAGKKPALVFDVDDTSLLTYNYELREDFGYDPETNDAYIRAQKMNAVFGMPKLVNWAQSEGYTVFFVTGRPEAQREATQGNLDKVGYVPDADAEHLFLKNEENPPSYLTCGAECTTVEYKSQTRKHIESQGYDVVANFGDQYSDLSGGYADKRYKIPNPMYYLP